MKAALRRFERAPRPENNTSKNQRLLGSWNLRTMQSDLHINTQGQVQVQGGGLGKLPNSTQNLQKYSVGIAAISEHRWKGKGEVEHGDWKFIYSGRDDDQKGASGVGIAMSREWAKSWKNAGSVVETKQIGL